eukprot:TRINITY_DN4037_c0_g1_i4.p1 TRINITY_DN4037_c0_g1~~TRINITY_DN4037_c0_g1_i4.p1  ORF type:complete len:294 (+),score=12.50 TRINITY_DN4037_c0_g1_i4:372-1253(+)
MISKGEQMCCLFQALQLISSLMMVYRLIRDLMIYQNYSTICQNLCKLNRYRKQIIKQRMKEECSFSCKEWMTKKYARLCCGHSVCFDHAKEQYKADFEAPDALVCGICNAVKEIKNAKLDCGCLATNLKDYQFKQDFYIICPKGHALSIRDVSVFFKNEVFQKIIKCLNKLPENFPARSIDMTSKFIGDVGVMALLLVLEKKKFFIALNLSRNEFGDEGVKAISVGLEKNTLTALDLSENEFGDEGAKAISVVLEKKNTLTKIDLKRNIIGYELDNKKKQEKKKNKKLTKKDV